MTVDSIIFGLTLRQPWATSIVDGPKRVENREWKPRVAVPFWLAIHAGLGADTDDEEWVRPMFPGLAPARLWERGAIIGVCRVVEVVSFRDMPSSQYDEHKAWAVGPWCWILDSVTRLPRPVRCKGALGLWRLGDALLDDVCREWPAEELK